MWTQEHLALMWNHQNHTLHVPGWDGHVYFILHKTHSAALSSLFFFSFYFQIHSCSEESISLEALLFSWHNELVDCFCQTGLSIHKTTVTHDGPDHARRQEARRCWRSGLLLWPLISMYIFILVRINFFFNKNINSLFLSYFYFILFFVLVAQSCPTLQPHGL